MSTQRPSNPFQALAESNDTSGLSGLARKAQLLAQIGQIVDAILPLEIRPHVQVANVRDQTLILMADSPAWNTKVRFLSHTLLTELNRLCKSDLHRIQTQTRPATTDPLTSSEDTGQSKDWKPAPTVPSASTARQIGDAAQSLEDDALRDALQRLSRHMLAFKP